MPSRKPHSKSRHGCVQCKTRKLKCDEEKPSCARCLARQDKCCYKNLLASDPAFRPTMQPVPAAYGTTGEPLYNLVSILPMPSSVSDLKHQIADSMGNLSPDLELMYHLTTSTTFSLPNRDRSDLWQVVAPELALTRSFLMHGLLACSALHLAYLHPSSAKKYTDLAMSHHTLCFEQFRHELNNVNENNAVSLFLLSAVVVCTSYAMPHVALESLDENETLHHFLDIFRLQNGVMEVLNAGRVYLQDTPILEKLRVNFNEDTPIPVEDEEMLSLIERHINSEADSELKDMYIQAADQLRRCYPFEDRVKDRQAMILAWPIMISSGLFKAIEEKEAIAMALVVFYGAEMSLLDSWWAYGRGRKLVLAASSFLPESGDWARLTTWTRNRAGCDNES